MCYVNVRIFIGRENFFISSPSITLLVCDTHSHNRITVLCRTLSAFSHFSPTKIKQILITCDVVENCLPAWRAAVTDNRENILIFNRNFFLKENEQKIEQGFTTLRAVWWNWAFYMRCMRIAGANFWLYAQSIEILIMTYGNLQ